MLCSTSGFVDDVVFSCNGANVHESKMRRRSPDDGTIGQACRLRRLQLHFVVFLIKNISPKMLTFFVIRLTGTAAESAYDYYPWFALLPFNGLAGTPKMLVRKIQD